MEHGAPSLNQLATLAAPGWSTSAMSEMGSGGELWYLKADAPPATATTATLSVPLLQVQEPGEGSIRLKAVTGPVDQTVTLGRWKVRFLRTELLDGNLRAYVDLGSAQTTYLSGFTMEPKPDRGHITGWEARMDEVNGQVQWVELPVPAGARTVTLTLRDPRVTVQGPWVIEVPIGR